MKLLRHVLLVSVFLSVPQGLFAAQAESTQISGKRLTISVKGKATGTADRVRLSFMSQATAEKTSDALKQCKDKADAATKAIEILGIEDLVIRRDMYRFSRPDVAAYQMIQAATLPSGMQVSQPINVSISAIQPINTSELAVIISRVIDASKSGAVGPAKPAGIQAQIYGGAPPFVEYELSDASALKGHAIIDALAKARSVKKSFEMNDIPVGKLVSIQFGQQDAIASGNIWEQAVSQFQQETSGASTTSDTPNEIVVECSITLVYEIEP